MDKKEKKEMQKPLSLAIVELKKELANIINNSGIPIYNTGMVLKEM